MKNDFTLLIIGIALLYNDIVIANWMNVKVDTYAAFVVVFIIYCMFKVFVVHPFRAIKSKIPKNL